MGAAIKFFPLLFTPFCMFKWLGKEKCSQLVGTLSTGSVHLRGNELSRWKISSGKIKEGKEVKDDPQALGWAADE